MPDQHSTTHPLPSRLAHQLLELAIEDKVRRMKARDRKLAGNVMGSQVTFLNGFTCVRIVLDNGDSAMCASLCGRHDVFTYERGIQIAVGRALKVLSVGH